MTVEMSLSTFCGSQTGHAPQLLVLATITVSALLLGCPQGPPGLTAPGWKIAKNYRLGGGTGCYTDYWWVDMIEYQPRRRANRWLSWHVGLKGCGPIPLHYEQPANKIAY